MPLKRKKEYHTTNEVFILGALSMQLVGSLWYLLSIKRQAVCWESECSAETGSINVTACSIRYLDCESQNQIVRQIWAQNTSVFQNCDPNNNNSTFNFGLFQAVLSNQVVSIKFLEKYLYCLWWGLQQLRYLHTP